MQAGPTSLMDGFLPQEYLGHPEAYPLQEQLPEPPSELVPVQKGSTSWLEALT